MFSLTEVAAVLGALLVKGSRFMRMERVVDRLADGRRHDPERT